MKSVRALIAIVVLFVPSLLWGTNIDREILLTEEGTLYAIESIYAETLPNVATESTKVLQLSTQKGETSETILVPASLGGGVHSDPALAYDSESETLLVFWQKTPNPRLNSDLLFCSYQDGTWSEPTLVDNGAFSFRFNLRIAVTRFVRESSAGGIPEKKPGLVIHAVWWNQDGYGEQAGYAMLALENGVVKSKRVTNLVDLLGSSRASAVVPVADNFDRDMLRNPAIFALGNDGVEVVFADWKTNLFQKLEIRPIRADGVLTPIIGIARGSFKPTVDSVTINSRMTIIPGTDDKKMLFYFRSPRGYDYLMLNDGVWSELKSVALSDRVSPEAAVEALRRLIVSQ